MRGLEWYITLMVVLGVVGLFLFVSFVFIFQPSNVAPPAGIMSGYIKKMLYDYSYLIIPPEEGKWPFPYTSSLSSFQSYWVEDRFCIALRNCIRNSIMNNMPCEVDGVAFGDLSQATQSYTFSLGCGGVVEYTIASDIKQKLCDLNTGSLSGYAGMPLSADDMNDTNGLSFEDCRLFDGKYGLENVLADEELNKAYYSRDRGYIGTSSAWLGPGRLRTIVNSARVGADGSCEFNLLLCPLPAIATSDKDGSLFVFDIARSLDFTHIPNVENLWWIRDRSSDVVTQSKLEGTEKKYGIFQTFSGKSECESHCPHSCVYQTSSNVLAWLLSLFVGTLTSQSWWECQLSTVTDKSLCDNLQQGMYCRELPASGSRDVYYYNPWSIDIGKNPATGNYWQPVILTNAVKQGLYENIRVIPNSSWWTPHWYVAKKTSMTKDKCWSTEYDNWLIDETGTGNLSRSILYDCGTDDLCGPNITMNAAVRRDWNETMSVYSTVVTICDQDA